MGDNPPPTKTVVTAFLSERGYISKDSTAPDSVDVFIKYGPANPLFLGTLNFSNPSHLVLHTREVANNTDANTLARVIAGGLEKSVSLT